MQRSQGFISLDTGHFARTLATGEKATHTLLRKDKMADSQRLFTTIGILTLCVFVVLANSEGHEQELQQLSNSDSDAEKRSGWNDLAAAFGKRSWTDVEPDAKRGWNSLGSAFGKRESEEFDQDRERRGWNSLGSAFGKRGWNSLGSAFGKRSWNSLGSAFGKRGWNSLGSAFGKRGWNSLGSAFGKRSWNSLGSAFGKRGWNSLGSAFGKRSEIEVSPIEYQMSSQLMQDIDTDGSHSIDQAELAEFLKKLFAE